MSTERHRQANASDPRGFLDGTIYFCLQNALVATLVVLLMIGEEGLTVTPFDRDCRGPRFQWMGSPSSTA